jgi:dCTP deaminase
MIFSDVDIIGAVVGGRVGIDPFHTKQVQPASYDLMLGCYVRYIDEDEPEKFDSIALGRGDFALFSTVETVTIPADLVAEVSGKSTWARLGLSVHQTAGWIDPGFSGQITLELCNLGPKRVLLEPGMLIAQLVIMELASPALNPYGHERLDSKYQNQRGPTAARPNRSA